MPRCLIFANGILPDPAAARRIIQDDDFIVCADGGTQHALTLDLIPRVLIGDLDSVSEGQTQQMIDRGVEVFQFPRDKNETDLELALDYAIEQNYREIVVMAALGGRLDQTLGNLSLLSALRPPSSVIRFDDGVEQAFFCRDHAEVRGMPGDIVSLLPWGGDVTGVRTQGLKWPLTDETLYSHKTRGVSNELLGDEASVTIASGLLLIVCRSKGAREQEGK
jgi:thiamine pyrophosphokinase